MHTYTHDCYASNNINDHIIIILCMLRSAIQPDKSHILLPVQDNTSFYNSTQTHGLWDTGNG